MYLYFQLIGCRNLKSMDLLSESDVYCKIWFQGIWKLTSMKQDDNNPTWGEENTFIFPIDPSKDMHVSVEIYDSDGFRSQIIETVSLDVMDAAGGRKEVSKGPISATYAQVYIYKDDDVDRIKALLLRTLSTFTFLTKTSLPSG